MENKHKEIGLLKIHHRDNEDPQGVTAVLPSQNQYCFKNMTKHTNLINQKISLRWFSSGWLSNNQIFTTSFEDQRCWSHDSNSKTSWCAMYNNYY